MLILLAAQAAAQSVGAAPAAEPALATPADIEIGVDATIREVRIRRRGDATLEVRGGEGSVVRVESPEAQGRARLRNVTIRVRAEARVTDGIEAEAETQATSETPEPG